MAELTRVVALLDAITGGSEDLIAAQDHDFRYTYFNAAYRREFKSLWGVELQPGQNMLTLLAPWPEECARARRLWSRALAGEAFVETAEFGPTDGARQVYALRFHPVRDARGTLLGAAHILSNITERHRAEQRLLARERRSDLLARLGDATRSLSDGHEVALAAMQVLREKLNADRCTWADFEPDQNHFRFAGVDAAPGVPVVSGRFALSAFGEQALVRLRAGKTFVCADAFSDLPDGAERASYEQTGIRAFIAAPIHRAGQLVAGTGVHMQSPRQWSADEIELVQAVTERCWESIERARAETALRVADRRKDEFLATLSHELRNPLAPLRNGLSLLKHAGSDPRALERVHAMMERQVQQFARLIDDLVDLSRITRGHIELRREPIELATVIQHAVEMIKPMLAQRTLLLHLPQRPIRLDADGARLTQVFTNLLSNACKFTRPDGYIVVNVERTGEQATVSIADDGQGIAADDIERIFEMFAQVGAPDGAVRSGLGIGLTLVRQLVELHEGKVYVRSDGPGRGSEFVVQLPSIAPEEGAVARAAGQAPRPGALEQRVLVIDDNEDAAWSTAMLLQMWGQHTEVAFDGASGLVAAERFRPDLVLLDIGMPTMDGLQVCRALRAHSWGRSMRVIALTGWGQPEDRRATREAGFDDHLVKPIDDISLASLLAPTAPHSPPDDRAAIPG